MIAATRQQINLSEHYSTVEHDLNAQQRSHLNFALKSCRASSLLLCPLRVVACSSCEVRSPITGVCRVVSSRGLHTRDTMHDTLKRVVLRAFLQRPRPALTVSLLLYKLTELAASWHVIRKPRKHLGHK